MMNHNNLRRIDFDTDFDFDTDGLLKPAPFAVVPNLFDPTQTRKYSGVRIQEPE